MKLPGQKQFVTFVTTWRTPPPDDGYVSDKKGDSTMDEGDHNDKDLLLKTQVADLSFTM